MWCGADECSIFGCPVRNLGARVVSKLLLICGVVRHAWHYRTEHAAALNNGDHPVSLRIGHLGGADKDSYTLIRGEQRQQPAGTRLGGLQLRWLQRVAVGITPGHGQHGLADAGVAHDGVGLVQGA